MNMKQKLILPLAPSLVMLILAHAPGTWASEDSMPHMPQIKPKSIYEVKGDQGDALQEQRGYGDQEPMVRMMNLMMIEGSGYEGMDMSGMDMEKQNMKTEAAGTIHFESTLTPSPGKVGANTLDILVTDLKGKPLKGLKLKAIVSMTTMNMGSHEAKLQENAPGKYRTQLIFSMKGPWTVKLLSGEKEEKVFQFNAGN
jgi:hypothetical protein